MSYLALPSQKHESSTEKAQNDYDEALKHYHDIKKNNESVRKLDMTKLAEDRAKLNHGSNEVEYNKMLHLEQETKSN